MANHLSLHIKKRYGPFELDISEEMTLDGLTILFGPSGSGKSTLLRLIAGFETPDTGEIKFNERVWVSAKSNLPPNKRPVGFMFQGGALFPHLSVRGNLDYAFKRNHGPSLTLENIIKSFDLTALLNRNTETLSGGERQRVALARTVLRRPKFLLLDEPLAALDRTRKREILPFLKRLPLEFDMPCLYVSHDIEEVSQIADRILLIKDGEITDSGPALDMLPKINGSDGSIGSVFDACFTGYNKESGLSTLRLGTSNLSVPAKISDLLNTAHRIRIDAKDVAISLLKPDGLSIRNSLAVRIETLEIDTKSPFANLTLRLENTAGDTPFLRARITRASAIDLNLTEGQSVFALVKSVSFAKTLI